MTDFNHVQPHTLTTLVLDKTYQCIGFFSARACVKHLITNRAHAYDRYGNLCDWDSWVNETSHHHDDIPYMNTSSRKFDIPILMVTTYYFGVKYKRSGDRSTSLNHLYKVYDGTCQYCMRKIPIKDATKDHVYPKSKGGPNCSSNLVLSCRSCNGLKADMYPFFNKSGDEVKPKYPSQFESMRMYGPSNLREEWKPFLHVD